MFNYLAYYTTTNKKNQVKKRGFARGSMGNIFMRSTCFFAVL